MIHIIDYGLGNVTAFATMFKRLGVDARLVSDPAELADARGIILPGVGAFDHAMALLDASGMRAVLEHKVRAETVPLLGVCVGMQILADGSDEGTGPGLGFIPGRVRGLAGHPAAAGLPLPHMGWNDIAPARPSPLLAGLEQDARFYFLHSYYFDAEAPDETLATTHYGMDFSCLVGSGNVFGIQCHPEKSHHWGSRLLRNFAEIVGC